MAKSIIKEIIIILLLILAIIVILGLLLYEYVPMAKVVPEPVSYSTPEDVKEELLESGEIDESQVIMTYEVNSSDLNNYERINNYNPGKANPFSTYQTQQENETGESTGGTTGKTTTSTTGTSSNANSGSSSNTGAQSSKSQDGGSSSSGGTFFQDKGTK